MAIIPVEDRLALHELNARYALNCDTKRYREMSALWAQDGIWDETAIGLPLCAGRTAIDEFFCGPAPAAVEFIHHTTSNHLIDEFDGKTASGTVHLYAEGRFYSNVVRVFGYYADQYTRVDGRWVFQARRLVEIAPSQGLSGAAAVDEAHA